jgi:hypothetical protein
MALKPIGQDLQFELTGGEYAENGIPESLLDGIPNLVSQFIRDDKAYWEETKQGWVLKADPTWLASLAQAG